MLLFGYDLCRTDKCIVVQITSRLQVVYTSTINQTGLSGSALAILKDESDKNLHLTLRYTTGDTEVGIEKMGTFSSPEVCDLMHNWRHQDGYAAIDVHKYNTVQT